MHVGPPYVCARAHGRDPCVRGDMLAAMLALTPRAHCPSAMRRRITMPGRDGATRLCRSAARCEAAETCESPASLCSVALPDGNNACLAALLTRRWQSRATTRATAKRRGFSRARSFASLWTCAATRWTRHFVCATHLCIFRDGLEVYQRSLTLVPPESTPGVPTYLYSPTDRAWLSFLADGESARTNTRKRVRMSCSVRGAVPLEP